MMKTTHIASLAQLAIALNEFSGDRRRGENPLNLLANMLNLNVESHQFIRVLTWIIAFYNEGIRTVETSTLSEKNKSASLSNMRTLFQPFLPPFQSSMQTWFGTAMSQTNQSYFDLLSDSLRDQNAIYVPDQEDLDKYRDQLMKLLEEIEQIGLPKWINDDFNESISLTLSAIDKIPFLAHRVIQDAHATILARLFSVSSPDHKRFMVKVATVMNVILAAFVMPHEATEAGNAYYEWIAQSPVSQAQIDDCAKPLALPAPTSAGG